MPGDDVQILDPRSDSTFEGAFGTVVSADYKADRYLIEVKYCGRVTTRRDQLRHFHDVFK